MFRVIQQVVPEFDQVRFRLLGLITFLALPEVLDGLDDDFRVVEQVVLDDALDRLLFGRG